MKNPAAFLVALTLAGCTSLDGYYNDCQAYKSFADQVLCVRQAVQADGTMRDDTLVQEYLMTGENLVVKVRAGALSEDDARLAFLRKLNEVEERRTDRLAKEAEISRTHKPLWGPFTSCHRNGSAVNCVTH